MAGGGVSDSIVGVSAGLAGGAGLAKLLSGSWAQLGRSRSRPSALAAAAGVPQVWSDGYAARTAGRARARLMSAGRGARRRDPRPAAYTSEEADDG